MLTTDGRPGPIEERLGRRLVRLIPPDSREWVALLMDRRVELFGPGGEPLGRAHPAEAAHLLRERIERRLEDTADAGDREALREGLDRSRAWSTAFGSGR